MKYKEYIIASACLLLICLVLFNKVLFSGYEFLGGDSYSAKAAALCTNQILLYFLTDSGLRCAWVSLQSISAMNVCSDIAERKKQCYTLSHSRGQLGWLLTDWPDQLVWCCMPDWGGCACLEGLGLNILTSCCATLVAAFIS